MVNLSPQEIIDALYNVSTQAAKATTTIIQQLDDIPPHDLFESFNSLVEAKLIVPYLCAILAGSSTASTHAATRREFCFIYAIKALKGCQLSTSERRQLLSCLHANLPLLPSSSHLRISDSITTPFSPTCSTDSIAGHAAALELLPALLSSTLAAKQHAVAELTQQEWSQHAIVVCSHALTELAAPTELLATQAYTKIITYLTYPPTSSSAAIDDIPQLVYHLTLLCHKHVTLLHRCLERIVHVLDSMADAKQDQRVGAVIATILHHLSLLIIKDQNMSQAILSMTKAFSPSPSSLSILLLASRSPRMESKLLTLAADRIESVHVSELSKNRSMWIQKHTWESACSASPTDIHASFLRLLHSPLLTEQVTPPLLQLGLLLLSKTLKSVALPSLSGVTHCTTVTAPYPLCSPAALGAWIIGELYYICEAARSTIMKELLARLQTKSLPTDAPSTDTYIANILKYISSLHPDLPLEFPALIPDLHPTTASEVIQLLADAATITPGVADRVILALRKGSFSREVPCQAATLSALLSVLKLQLSSSSSPPLTSYLSQSSQVDTVESFGIAFDEIIALCKRLLHSQYSIRYMVYLGLCDLAEEVVFRRIALRVLMQHALVYVHDTLAMEKVVSTNGTVLESIGDLSIALLFIARKGLELTSSDSLSQDSSIDISGECSETCNFLWRLVSAVIATPCPAVIASLATYGQCLALSDIYHASMVLVMLLPNSRTIEQRYRYLEQLVELKYSADAAILLYRNQLLSAHRKRKRDEAKTDNSANVMATQELFTEQSLGVHTTAGDDRRESTLPSLQRDNIAHRFINSIAIVELEGSIQLLLAFNLMEGEYPDQLNETQEEEYPDLATSGRATELHEYALSKCLDLLEQFVKFSLTMKSSAYQCTSMQRLKNEDIQPPHDLTLNANKLLQLIPRLFGVLLRDFIRMRSILLEMEGGPQEPLILCARNMLGCLYIVSIISEVGTEHSSATVGLAKLMQEGFKSARIGGDQIQTIEILDVEAAHQILELLTRHFVKLYSSMMTREKGAAGVIVSMISVFLEHLRGQYKKQIVEQIFKHKEKLADTTSTVCQHVLQSICETCDTPADGFSILASVGELIEEAGRNCTTVASAMLSTTDKILCEFDTLYALSNQSSLVPLPDVLSMMCLTLRKTMNIGVILLQCLDKSVVVKIVTLWVRLIKLQVKVIKSAITYTTKTSPPPPLLPMFCDLCSMVSNTVSPQLQEYLVNAHNLATKAKSGKRDAKDARLGKIIPELIYQLEQVDAFIIKLTGYLKDRDKHIAGKWIKRIAARDFKVKLQHQPAPALDNDDAPTTD